MSAETALAIEVVAFVLVYGCLIFWISGQPVEEHSACVRGAREFVGNGAPAKAGQGLSVVSPSTRQRPDDSA